MKENMEKNYMSGKLRAKSLERKTSLCIAISSFALLIVCFHSFDKDKHRM